MEGILVAQDEVVSNFEEFWRDDRFPQFEAERQLLQAVRTRNFSAASMIVKSNHGHSCDVNACIPRVSAERPKWSRRKRTILYEDTPAFVAAENGDYQMFEFLAKHKSDFNRQNDIGMTPLHAACSGGHAMIVKYICDHDRSTVDCKDHRGRTPAYFAAQNGEVDILTFMIIYLANFDIANSEGKTPLAIACANGHLEVVKLLLSRKCSLSAADTMGMLPLHHACAQGRGDIVNYLCAKETPEGEKVIDIHATDKLGRTTFFITAQNGHEAVVRILIENGAKVTDTYSGYRPFDAARQQGHTEICKIITDKIAKDKGISTKSKKGVSALL